MQQPAVDRANPDSVVDLDAAFLPVGHMRQLSRVTLAEERRVEGEVDLAPSHWVYEEHFPGDPIFPGTLMIEAAGQLVAAWAWHEGERGRPRLVRTGADFRAPVTPDDSGLRLATEVRSRGGMHFAEVDVAADGRSVARVEVVLTVLE